MPKPYRSIAVIDRDWERLKALSIKDRKPVTRVISELLDFYEAHHGNGEKARPKRDVEREE